MDNQREILANTSPISIMDNQQQQWSMLLSPFKKIRLLGSGSYGKVFLASSHTDQSQLFAIKSSLYSYSLCKEDRIYSNLMPCPEVLHCLGHYVSMEGRQAIYNLVLQYIPGGTLLGFMRARGGKLPETHVRAFTRVLVKGLAWIHFKGYVHCDLKPENILVCPPSNHLKIADFGLAKEPGREETPIPYKFRGTCWYMSPESVELGEIGPPLDIWSLGCIIIQMLTGRPVWGHTAKENDVFNHLVVAKEAPKIPEDLSVEVKDFLSKCLARNPNERWSAEMLLYHPFITDECDVPIVSKYLASFQATRNASLGASEAGGFKESSVGRKEVPFKMVNAA